MSPRIAERLHRAATVEKARWHAWYMTKQYRLDGKTTDEDVADAFQLWQTADNELRDARAAALDEAAKIPY